jgi:hypothetical protein
MSTNFEIPPLIETRYGELYDLVQNKSVDGHIDVKQLAEYYRRDKAYIQSCIMSGAMPFAFAPYGGGRAVSQIGILPLYLFETQGSLVRMKVVQDKKIM